jgi:hypothetical protein
VRPSLSLAGNLVALSRPVEGLAYFDLDGRRLSRDLVPEPLVEGGTSRIAGCGIDGDRRVWVADHGAGAVRVFTPFGREVARLVDARPGPGDTRGRIGRPWALAVRGDGDGLELLVARRESLRHALQVFDERGALIRSLRPRGESHGHFEGLEGVAFDERFLVAVESHGAVHVHRDFEHHFTFETRLADAALRAVAPAGGGRLLVACANNGLVLFDGSGRLITRVVANGPGDDELDGASDLAVERGRSDDRRRVVVVDREGERVRVFSLRGHCFGPFALD